MSAAAVAAAAAAAADIRRGSPRRAGAAEETARTAAALSLSLARSVEAAGGSSGGAVEAGRPRRAWPEPESGSADRPRAEDGETAGSIATSPCAQRITDRGSARFAPSYRVTPPSFFA